MVKKLSLMIFLVFTVPCQSAESKFDIRKIIVATTASFLSYVTTGRATWRLFSNTAVQKIRSILRPLITASRSSDYNTTTAKREVANFSKISLCAPGELRIQYGSKAGLSITADKDDLQYLTSSVVNQELKLRLGLWAVWFHYFKKPPQYVITVNNTPSLSISMNGTGNVILNNLHMGLLELICSGSTKCKGSVEVRQLNLKAQGSAAIELGGKAINQNLELSDSSIYDAQDLKSNDITIAVRNTSRAKILAYKTISLRPGKGLIEICNNKVNLSMQRPHLLSDAGTIRFITGKKA